MTPTRQFIESSQKDSAASSEKRDLVQMTDADIYSYEVESLDDHSPKGDQEDQ